MTPVDTAASAETERAPRPLPEQVFLLGLVLTAIIGLYDGLVVTHYGFHWTGLEPGWRLFPGMWDRLREGRFDMNPEDVRTESFLRDGRTYSYFGPFPALLRGVVSLFLPAVHPGIPQLSCALAATIAAAAFLWTGLQLRLFEGAQRRSFVLFLVVVTLSTPMLVGLSLAHVYNEASLWGCAWASVFTAGLVRFGLSPCESLESDHALLLMATASGFALLSRVTCGAETVLMMLGALSLRIGDAARGGGLRAGLRRFVGRRNVRIALGIWILLGGFQAFVNYKRWGNPFEFGPYRLHVLIAGTERGERLMKAGFYRLDRIPSSLCYYWISSRAMWLRHWPFVSFDAGACFSDNSPYYDYRGSSMVPLFVCSPALLVLSLRGILRTRWNRSAELRDRIGWLLVGNELLIGAMLLTFYAVAPRYVLDFVPSLLGLALLGIVPRATEAPAPPGVLRRLGWGALATLVVVSILTAHLAMVNAAMSEPGTPTASKERLARIFHVPRPAN